MGAAANPANAVNPYQGAAMATAQAAQNYAQPNVQQFMNPYNQAVVDKTLRDVSGAAQMGMNQLDAQATQAGAFGGSRHGIAMAEAAKGYQQQALDKVGALNQAGYNQALDTAFRSAAGLQGIGQQAFGMGQSIQQQQMQQGAMQQAAMQSLIDAAKAQYQGYQNAPRTGLAAMMGGAGLTSGTQGQQQSYTPGLYDYLTAGAKIYAGM